MARDGAGSGRHRRRRPHHCHRRAELLLRARPGRPRRGRGRRGHHRRVIARDRGGGGGGGDARRHGLAAASRVAAAAAAAAAVCGAAPYLCSASMGAVDAARPQRGRRDADAVRGSGGWCLASPPRRCRGRCRRFAPASPLLGRGTSPLRGTAAAATGDGRGAAAIGHARLPTTTAAQFVAVGCGGGGGGCAAAAAPRRWAARVACLGGLCALLDRPVCRVLGSGARAGCNQRGWWRSRKRRWRQCGGGGFWQVWRDRPLCWNGSLTLARHLLRCCSFCSLLFLFVHGACPAGLFRVASSEAVRCALRLFNSV